uniref:Pre-mRNA-splicing factor SLU7 n=1 Tax=Lactuca sativa TaxID=4236 RepID=A0A9R1WJY0_LACSA|nr:hypothetical protein LSAT_V11C100048110 [Lactuca sativa]
MGDIHQVCDMAFKSRKDHMKQMELEEAREVGLAPAEVDEDGKEINPHIPQYMSSAPWYLNTERPSLKHQRKWKSDPYYTKSWYDRGAKIYQVDKYRKGACKNCGAMTHTTKRCMERPRKLGAKWTSKNIAPDEKIETFELDYDGKRDRKKFLKDQQLKKLEEKGNTQNVEEVVSDDEDNEETLVLEALSHIQTLTLLHYRTTWMLSIMVRLVLELPLRVHWTSAAIQYGTELSLVSLAKTLFNLVILLLKNRYNIVNQGRS